MERLPQDKGVEPPNEGAGEENFNRNFGKGPSKLAKERELQQKGRLAGRKKANGDARKNIEGPEAAKSE